MRVRILPAALRDLHSASLFYERQRPGAGEYLLASIQEDIDSLAENGGIHSRVLGYHGMVARHFPHAIYYRLEANVVTVHAIIDSRRDPRRAVKRLEHD